MYCFALDTVHRIHDHHNHQCCPTSGVGAYPSSGALNGQGALAATSTARCSYYYSMPRCPDSRNYNVQPQNQPHTELCDGAAEPDCQSIK